MRGIYIYNVYHKADPSKLKCEHSREQTSQRHGESRPVGSESDASVRTTQFGALVRIGAHLLIHGRRC